MQNFDFHNPTRVVFGPGRIDELGPEVAALGSSALLVTGKGHVHRSGTYDRAARSLAGAGVRCVDLSGVDPNPRLESINRGAALIEEHDLEVVVALGGGSVMDAGKVIAAVPLYEGDPWEMILRGPGKQRLPVRALPIVAVPTLAATGSEMNGGAVISRPESREKSYVIAPCLFPAVAVVDPELTLSVPADQTANGCVDMISHVTETYFNCPDRAPLQDRIREGVVLTAMEVTPGLLERPDDLEARAIFQWASIVALNGWARAGAGGPYPVHAMEHVVSAHHDIAHGAGLAILTPAWMRISAPHNTARFVQFAQRIFGLEASGPDDLDAAVAGIDTFEQFLAGIGAPTRLGQVGIGGADLERMAADTVRINGTEEGLLPGIPPLDARQLEALLRTVL